MRKDLPPDEPVCVQAYSKTSGQMLSCTACDNKDSSRYADYYRRIGYKAKVLTYDELESETVRSRLERIRFPADLQRM